MVAVVLRRRDRTLAANRGAPARMRQAALRVHRARPMAAIRAWVSGVLPEPGAPARPKHHLVDDRPDAEPAADLPRMGSPWRVLGPAGARLFRDCAQGARGGEDPGRLS